MNVLDSISIRDCTSCQLCAAVCPKHAINIRLDDDGFYRPIVDSNLCVDCSICTHYCYKFDNSIEKTAEDSLVSKPLYSAWVKDELLLKETTSGAIGDILARTLIEKGYKVVGVVYNDTKVRAEHAIAKTKEDTVPFRGSKYIQSYTFDTFKEVVLNCKNEKYAVFGTPCQIYALNKFATQRGVRDNFFFVDLYCHGCPSLLIWKKYQAFIKDKTGCDHFDKVVFRSKVKGWGSFYVVVVVVDGKTIFVSSPKNDGFYELFFSDQVLNEACTDCQLRSTLEYTDIRLGDFWGKKFLYNHKGVSAVSLVTERAKSLFSSISTYIEGQECDYIDFLPYQCWGKNHKVNLQTRVSVLCDLKDDSKTIHDIISTFRKKQGMKASLRRIVKSILFYLPLSVTNTIKKIKYD